MGRLDAKLNSLSRRIDKLVIQDAAAICTCKAIQVFSVGPGEKDPVTPQGTCRMHPKQINSIVIHHTADRFERRDEAEEVLELEMENGAPVAGRSQDWAPRDMSKFYCG